MSKKSFLGSSTSCRVARPLKAKSPKIRQMGVDFVLNFTLAPQFPLHARSRTYRWLFLIGCEYCCDPCSGGSFSQSRQVSRTINSRRPAVLGCTSSHHGSHVGIDNFTRGRVMIHSSRYTKCVIPVKASLGKAWPQKRRTSEDTTSFKMLPGAIAESGTRETPISSQAAGDGYVTLQNLLL